MNANSHLAHRRGRTSASATPSKPVAKSPAKLRSTRRTAPAPASKRVLLVRWTAVFPLSSGPAERVRRHAAARTGVDDAADLLDAIASYVRELADRVPPGCTVDADGNLFGPEDFAADAGDVLFQAVFATDLDGVLSRARTTESVPATTSADE